ncbi:MAG: alpha/beta hydrolase [Ideonella sp.]|nr:alpha/beta hydrolase [Ideonella sp.]MBL0150777.1 alpha/beta hydrolase [Ideonella sp.]
MVSWQTKALNRVLHWTIKRVMSGTGTVQQTRRFIEVKGKPRLPPGVEMQPVLANAFRGEWVRTPESTDERTLLYLPGGGFMLPASSQVPLMVARINREARTRALLVHYRLAPEHPFPAGLEDCLAAYRHLLALGTDPRSIVIAGDSAGGGLTLSTLLALRDDGDPLPGGAVVISPFTDFSFGGESRFSNARHDPLLAPDGIARMNALYLDDTLHDNPLVSPVYGDFRGLPPILAQVGSTEILLDDTRRVAERAASQGVDFEVEVWDEVPHVWHVWGFLPETKAAITRIAAFIQENMPAAAPADAVARRPKSSATPSRRKAPAQAVARKAAAGAPRRKSV